MLRLGFAIGVALALQTVSATPSELKVHISAIAPAHGQVLYAVFDTADAWLDRPVASGTLTVQAAGTARFATDLPPGTYAIALIHDENGNGEMDTNALGLPTEAFGFSNRARARFGPPPFERAAFELPPGGLTTTISMTRKRN